QDRRQGQLRLRGGFDRIRRAAVLAQEFVAPAVVAQAVEGEVGGDAVDPGHRRGFASKLPATEPCRTPAGQASALVIPAPFGVSNGSAGGPASRACATGRAPPGTESTVPSRSAGPRALDAGWVRTTHP